MERKWKDALSLATNQRAALGSRRKPEAGAQSDVHCSAAQPHSSWVVCMNTRSRIVATVKSSDGGPANCYWLLKDGGCDV